MKTLWAIKQHGRPDWDIYVAYSRAELEHRVNHFKSLGLEYEILCFKRGTVPAWQH